MVSLMAGGVAAKTPANVLFVVVDDLAPIFEAYNW